jgi:hypothetical protein
MTELERALVALGRELEYPVTPDIARAVERRLAGAARPRAAGGPRPGSAAGWRAGRAVPGLRVRRVALIAATVLLLASGTVFAAVPAVRDAVLEFLHLRGATVERRERLPAGLKPGELDLGPRTTLPAARKAIGFDPLLPAGLGPPAEVHLRRATPGGELLLLYRRPRTLISEFRGDLHPSYVGKITPQATTVERLRVGDSPAVWIEGAPHFFFYRDPRGTLREETLRLAGNVLLVERDRLLVRLEGDLDRATAVRIAESLR